MIELCVRPYASPDCHTLGLTDRERKRIVVREPDDIRALIEEYQAFRFVPDVNELGSGVVDRVPIDLDRPPSIGWKQYASFVNEFVGWLKGHGSHPRLRLSGGMGAHVVLDLRVNRIAKSYATPFPRELKFETWIDRVGESGLIAAQASDFVRILGIAFGIYRKGRLGKAAPITIERARTLGQIWYDGIQLFNRDDRLLVSREQ